MPPRLIFAKNIFITQYAKAMRASSSNSPITVFWGSTKFAVRMAMLCSDSPWACSPEKMRVKSPAKVFCRLMQNLYNSTGATPMREQAKNPFSTFIAVVLTLALPVWYSIAISKTATTVPAINSDQPKRVNKDIVALTQLRLKISAPMFPIMVKKSLAASKIVL